MELSLLHFKLLAALIQTNEFAVGSAQRARVCYARFVHVKIFFQYYKFTWEESWARGGLNRGQECGQEYGDCGGRSVELLVLPNAISSEYEMVRNTLHLQIQLYDPSFQLVLLSDADLLIMVTGRQLDGGNHRQGD